MHEERQGILQAAPSFGSHSCSPPAIVYTAFCLSIHHWWTLATVNGAAVNTCTQVF